MDTTSDVDLSPKFSPGDIFSTAAAADKNYRKFSVSPETFRKFQIGKTPYERWSKFLDEGDESHAEIKNYAQKHRNHTVVLQCKETGALRAIRRRSSNGL